MGAPYIYDISHLRVKLQNNKIYCWCLWNRLISFDRRQYFGSLLRYLGPSLLMSSGEEVEWDGMGGKGGGGGAEG